MEQLEQKLNGLNIKLQQLLKLYVLLQKQNQQLNAELEKAHQQLLTSEAKAAQLERKLAAKSIASPALGAEEKAELQKRIDGYLREIDKCLEMLNA